MAFSFFQRASAPFLGSSNPVLGRELRQTLRNERAFALLAIYVSILGAVVASQFPADQAVAVGAVQPGSGEGYKLFITFCMAQAFFVVAVLPALAAGALAQERERGTLESFLLTPLTPREIVWGKAAGVLCFGGLLLAATLPLTSLSFLLGGVSPADVITAYVVLLALAAFVTGFGLYCSARWTNAVRATITCYAMLPFALALLVVFMGPGSIIAGVTLILGSFWGALRALPHWKNSRVGKRLGFAAEILFYLALLAVFVFVVLLLAGSYGLGLRLFMIVFVTPYLLYVAKLGLERTGDELARHREPEGPTRERLNDLRAEWQRAVEAPTEFVPAQYARHSYTPPAPTPVPTAPAESEWAELSPVAPPKPKAPSTVEIDRTLIVQKTAKARRERGSQRTYQPHFFLPDRWNPVFTRDLRAGFLGRASWLARASYGALILGQVYFVLRLGFPLLIGNAAFTSAWRQMAGEWPAMARLHLCLLLLAGAVFGARAFAPEREQQTLPQLLTTPLPYRAIIGGKLMAALVYTGYAFVLGAPLTICVSLLGFISPLQGLRFLALQLLLGLFAAAWGLLCSMRGLTARRALGWSLGGVGALIGGEMILSTLDATSGAAARALHLLPMSLVPVARTSLPAPDTLPAIMPFAVYSALTIVFLVLTLLDFKSYASQV